MSASPPVPVERGSAQTLQLSESNQQPGRKVQTRIYRACVHCRQRKSKCDLESVGEPGRPPCRRCIREQRECVLAGSKRGGRRVRKAKVDAKDSKDIQAPDAGNNAIRDGRVDRGSVNPNETFPSRWPSWPSAESGAETYSRSAPSPNVNPSVEKAIASAEIQNPSDALDILAQVAGDAGTADRATSTATASDLAEQTTSLGRSAADEAPLMSFPPIASGTMTIGTVTELFDIYHHNYHPFFPIAPEEIFHQDNLQRAASEAPYLFSAILTIASADHLPNSTAHQECLSHTQSLTSDLIYGFEGNVQAVEALLILAEWSNWHHGEKVRLGKGRESASAWMLVGTAVRLGYLLGLDRTAFRNDGTEPTPHDLHRRRMVWAACYMADRQASIRVGRGFWSRGPGPLTGFQPGDFPSLRAKAPESDDYASIFKANLELTQLFSNAHDILYSNRGRELKLILAGDYVKYIDDFRAGIRGWHSVYGTLTCSTKLKISLLLTYDYLRLYVNAFAFQAALTRLISGERDTFTQKSVATEPDARFIYESVDAAKSILTTVNNFVDPLTCLRYLPLRFYLYIVHGAVFLYKAFATGTMSSEEKENVRRMVVETVSRLQKSSTSSAHVGARYAKLINLLWKRPPKQKSDSQKKIQNGHGTDVLNSNRTNEPVIGASSNGMQLNTFSWLDLDSVGNFAAQNNANNFSPGYTDFAFMPDDLNAVGLTGVDSQQWFNDDNPQSYIF